MGVVTSHTLDVLSNSIKNEEEGDGIDQSHLECMKCQLFVQVWGLPFLFWVQISLSFSPSVRCD